MKLKKEPPKLNKPHIFKREGKWHMTAMPRHIQGERVGRWARANMFVFNRNGGRKQRSQR